MQLSQEPPRNSTNLRCASLKCFYRSYPPQHFLLSQRPLRRHNEAKSKASSRVCGYVIKIRATNLTTFYGLGQSQEAKISHWKQSMQNTPWQLRSCLVVYRITVVILFQCHLGLIRSTQSHLIMVFDMFLKSGTFLKVKHSSWCKNQLFVSHCWCGRWFVIL